MTGPSAAVASKPIDGVDRPAREAWFPQLASALTTELSLGRVGLSTTSALTLLGGSAEQKLQTVEQSLPVGSIASQ